jgi:hypothetical protein
VPLYNPIRICGWMYKKPKDINWALLRIELFLRSLALGEKIAFGFGSLVALGRKVGLEIFRNSESTPSIHSF